jgi:hypothetical protein
MMVPSLPAGVLIPGAPGGPALDPWFTLVRYRPGRP